MRPTSSPLDRPSLASKEFIMKQKDFDIIRIKMIKMIKTCLFRVFGEKLNCVCSTINP